MTTEDNLEKAFAGESQANRKYLAFFRKAKKDGFPGIAKLFRAVAEAETVHALNHLKTLGGINSTQENLKKAINGETKEFEEMYPGMLKKAREEGNRDAEKSFRYANEVEKIHAELYKKALESVKNGEDLDKEYFVCQTCGNTLEELPETCTICGMPKGQFKKIE
jgi:rubrerythrin